MDSFSGFGLLLLFFVVFFFCCFFLLPVQNKIPMSLNLRIFFFNDLDEFGISCGIYSLVSSFGLHLQLLRMLSATCMNVHI